MTHLSRSTRLVFALLFVAVVVVLAAKHQANVVTAQLASQDNPFMRFSPQEELLPAHYACTYGHYAPSCAMLEGSPLLRVICDRDLSALAFVRTQVRACRYRV